MASNSSSPSAGVHERAQEYMRTIALAKETAVKQAKETIEAKWGPSPKAEPDTAIAEKPKPSKEIVRSGKQKAVVNMESPTHGGMIAGVIQNTPQRPLQPLPEPFAEQTIIAGQQRSFQQQLSLSPEARTQLSLRERLGLNLAASTQYHYRPQHLSTPEHSQQPLTIAPYSNPPPAFPQPPQLAYQQPQITIPKQTYDNLNWENSALTYLIQKQTGCTIEAIHDWLRNEHKDQSRRQQELARRNRVRQAQLQQAEAQQAHAREAEMWRRIEEAESEVREGQKTFGDDTMAHKGGS